MIVKQHTSLPVRGPGSRSRRRKPRAAVLLSAAAFTGEERALSALVLGLTVVLFGGSASVVVWALTLLP